MPSAATAASVAYNTAKSAAHRHRHAIRARRCRPAAAMASAARAKPTPRARTRPTNRRAPQTAATPSPSAQASQAQSRQPATPTARAGAHRPTTAPTSGPADQGGGQQHDAGSATRSTGKIHRHDLASASSMTMAAIRWRTRTADRHAASQNTVTKHTGQPGAATATSGTAGTTTTSASQHQAAGAAPRENPFALSFQKCRQAPQDTHRSALKRRINVPAASRRCPGKYIYFPGQIK